MIKFRLFYPKWQQFIKCHFVKLGSSGGFGLTFLNKMELTDSQKRYFFVQRVLLGYPLLFLENQTKDDLANIFIANLKNVDWPKSIIRDTEQEGSKSN